MASAVWYICISVIHARFGFLIWCPAWKQLGPNLTAPGPRWDGARLFRKCPYTLYNPLVVSGTLSALPSVLWCCCLISRKGIQPVKNYVVGCWHGYLSGARCRLAYVPALPLPLIVSCFSKIQIGFNFLVLAHPGNPRNRALNGCVNR